MLHPMIHGWTSPMTPARTGQSTLSGSIRRLMSVVLCVVVAACSVPHRKVAQIDPRLGVAPSPRVVEKGQPVPKGGGREMVGKPYVIAGRVYVPSADPRGLSQVGLASWYGDDFHGRYTANGEIYDMNHLSAAHPTMPLPSYARVTSLATGRSVLVRVNDRGPYHSNRIMDLSGGAARLLGVARLGVSKIKVDYVGRAPLNGNDMAFLQSTYRGPGTSYEPPKTGLAGNIPILGPILGKVFTPQPTAGFTPPPLRTGSIIPSTPQDPASSFAESLKEGEAPSAEASLAPETAAPETTGSLPAPSTSAATPELSPEVAGASPGVLTPAPAGAILPVERPHVIPSHVSAADAYDAFSGGKGPRVAAPVDTAPADDTPESLTHASISPATDAPLVLPVPRPSQLDQTSVLPAKSVKHSQDASLLIPPDDPAHAIGFAPNGANRTAAFVQDGVTN